MITIITLAGHPRFPLGQIVGTPGALEACAPEYLAACLTRGQDTKVHFMLRSQEQDGIQRENRCGRCRRRALAQLPHFSKQPTSARGARHYG